MFEFFEYRFKPFFLLFSRKRNPGIKTLILFFFKIFYQQFKVLMERRLRYLVNFHFLKLKKAFNRNTSEVYGSKFLIIKQKFLIGNEEFLWSFMRNIII